MAALAPAPTFYEHDANGDPLASGKVYTYANNSATPLATYTDAGGGTQNTNPVTLDAAGRANIWLATDALYTFVVKTAALATVYTVNDIGASALSVTFSGSGGSALVGFIQSGSGAAARTMQSKGREQVTPLDFGAAGNNSTTDTVSAQEELDGGHPRLTAHDATGYRVGALTVPTGVKSISGRLYTQLAANADVLSVTSSTRLTLRDVDITGVGGTTVAASNNGVIATTCDQLHIRGGIYTGLRFHPVYMSGCTNSSVDISGYGNSGGVRLRGCDGVMVRGSESDPQTPVDTFVVAYGLDSDNGHAYGQCKNIDLDVIVKNYGYSQAVLMHAGEMVRISGNFDNVLNGVSCGTFSATDVISQLTITGINYRGATSASIPTDAGNSGITVSGQADLPAKNITITGCTLTKTNYVCQSSSGAGMIVQYATGVAIHATTITDGYGSGIFIGAQTRGLTLIGASVKDMAADGTGLSIGVWVSGTAWADVQGLISGIRTSGCTDAVRLGSTSAAAATITSSSTTATLTKATHGFKVGDWIRVIGVTFVSAADAYYNGAFRVATVPTANTLTYTMRGAPATASAPGSPTVQGSYDGLFINDVSAPDATNLVANYALAVVDGARRYCHGDCFPWVEDTSCLTDVTNAAGNPIIGFAGMKEGQVLTLQFTDSNTSFADGGNFKLTGAFTSSANDTLVLMYDGTFWCEVSRSAN